MDPSNRKMSAVILSNRGLAFLRLGELAKAHEDFNASVELNPDYTRTYLRRAELLEKKGDFGAAIADLHKVREIDPNEKVGPEINRLKQLEKQAKKKDYYKILEVGR